MASLPDFVQPVIRDLHATDRVDSFSCGHTELDDWLQENAKTAHANRQWRVRVVADANAQVVAWYGLALDETVTESLQVSIARIGCIGVDKKWQKQGLGRALLRDALREIFQAGLHLPIACAVLHMAAQTGREEDLSRFYRSLGFVQMPGQPKAVLYLPWDTLVQAFAG